MVMGASLATAVIGFAWLRQRLLNRRYRRVIKKLETELHEMRSLPLAGSRSATSEQLRLEQAESSLDAPSRKAG
jgi:uncharacterized membrane protein YciS (DUF1049 family)